VEKYKRKLIQGEFSEPQVVSWGVLYVDLVNFSEETERAQKKSMWREHLIELEKFLKYSTKKIEDREGIVHKYLGDGIMAVFPGKTEEKIRIIKNMLKASIEIIKNCNKINKKCGIGLEYGDVYRTTIYHGRKKKKEIFGVVVNRAAKLQSYANDLIKLSRKSRGVILIGNNIEEFIREKRLKLNLNLRRINVKNKWKKLRKNYPQVLIRVVFKS